MKLNPTLGALLTFALLGASTQAAFAQNVLPDQTRKIYADNKDSVVTISGVVKLSFSAVESKSPLNAPDREQKFEATGTIIDPSGLVVVAMSMIDPSKEVETPRGRVRIEATVKEVKIVMSDGTEVPADVVMKDADLDLAFIKPNADSKEAKAATFKAVDLKKASSPQIADDTVTVWRTGELMNRQPAVLGGQVLAITLKPRTFLCVSNATLGCPTFAMDGTLMGIGVNRFGRGPMQISVVIPSADVAEIAEQAKAAKAPVPAESQPKDDKKTDKKSDEL